MDGSLAIKILTSYLVLRYTVPITRFFYEEFLRSPPDLYQRYAITASKLPRHDQWAVITGASQGIGKHFAIELASRGFNLILFARNILLLQNLNIQLENKYQVKVLYYSVDFRTEEPSFSSSSSTSSTSSISSVPATTSFSLFSKKPVSSSEVFNSSLMTNSFYLECRKIFEGKDISVLINNVGANPSGVKPFDETSVHELNEIININIRTAVNLTHQLILSHFKKRQKGLIMFLSSMAADIPCPYISTYSATKSFIDNFAQSLKSEFSNTLPHLDIISLQPLWVQSGMVPARHTNWRVMDTQLFVKLALNKIGTHSKYNPSWLHSFLIFFAKNLPKSIQTVWTRTLFFNENKKWKEGEVNYRFF